MARPHLLDDGENRILWVEDGDARVVEFECKNQKEHDVWTQGVSRLLSISAEKNNRYRV
ncbi:hypothetical protein F3Y22_tig00116971pilonHSYRG00195 [Hibiscus syriacus]|uniref:Pleckstrin-like plant domain-containing protein n=1 Tax=Hibiscus syriacus TaxID=106335 RepID=A0A6A2XW01_HIBSY|nr:hypothetical protein F3Y22_tig00116971pilonHSYRG00195 [Hibiscus syriacus]